MKKTSPNYIGLTEEEISFLKLLKTKSQILFFPENFQNKEFVKKCVQKDGSLLKILPKFQNDYEIVLESVKESGEALKFASDNFRDNKEIVFEAVHQMGSSIEFATQRFKNEKNLTIETLKHNIQAYHFIDDGLKIDRDFNIEVVKNNCMALHFIDEIFKNDKEIILNAVCKSELCFISVPDEMMKDVEVQWKCKKYFKLISEIKGELGFKFR
jgi:hypothetical protein